MDVSLTKDAKHSLAIIYRAYEKRRKAGTDKHSAAYFDGLSDDSVEVNAAILADKSELRSAGMISCDIVGGVGLKDAAIIYMENRTSDTIKEWLSFGAQFIP